MSEEKDDVCWCNDPSCPVKRDAKKIADLESRLAEIEKRAYEYHAEWESACLRERGRIEDVRDLESRLTQSEKKASDLRGLCFMMKYALEEIHTLGTGEMGNAWKICQGVEDKLKGVEI